MNKSFNPDNQFLEDDSINILFVDDDDEAFLELTERYFEKSDHDFNIETFTDTKKALERLKEDNIDCIVSDYLMPRMTGLEFLEKVREDHPNLPFLLITSKGSEEVASKAISAGVTDYIQKGGEDKYELVAQRAKNAVEAKRKDKDLEKRARQQEIAAELGKKALGSMSLGQLMQEASEKVAECLGNKYCKVLELKEEDELLLKEGVGWRDGLVGQAKVKAGKAENSQASYTFSSEKPVVVTDMEKEDRFEGPELLTSHNVKSGISTIIGDPDDPWGILGTHDVERKNFSQNDVEFVTTISNILADAIRREEHETTVQRIQGRYKALFDNFPNGSTALYDEDLRYTLAGGELIEKREERTGKKYEGRTIEELYPDDVVDKLRPKYEKALEGEKSFFEIKIEDKILKLITAPVKGTHGDIIRGLVISQDITEKKRYERELERKAKESEDLAEAMIDAVEDHAIFRLDPAGHVATWNNGAEKIKGYSEEDIIGEHFSKFYTEEDRENNVPEKNLEKARDKGKAEDSGWRVRKDGSRFWAEVTINAIRDEEGELLGFTKVTRDMTERREREANMKARLDEFSSMATHDLRNSLNTAEGYLNLGIKSGKEEDLEKANQALENLEDLVEDLEILTMTEEDIERKELRLKEIFSQACNTVIGTDLEYEVEDVTLEAGRSSLLRLLGNLIKNSVEHNRGNVEIRAGPLEGEQGFYYEDTGKGLNEKEKEKATEKGFSNSEEGEGLGLFIVNRITELQGWDIKITDSEEGGARFEFRR